MFTREKRSLAIALTDADAGNYEFRTEGEAKPATAFSATTGGLAVSLGAASIAVAKGDALALSTMVGNKCSIAAANGAGVKVGGADVNADGERFKVNIIQ